MKPEQFIREFGVKKAREVVEGAPEGTTHIHSVTWQNYKQGGNNNYVWGRSDQAGWYLSIYDTLNGMMILEDLKRLVESLDRFNKFEDTHEALDAIDDAPEGATDYRKLSCGTRYIKQGPRFFEYWNGSEWCRPTVPFTEETHILRFDKLEDLKQSI